MLRAALRTTAALAFLSSLIPVPAHAAPAPDLDLEDTAYAVLLDWDPLFDFDSEGGRAALAKVECDLEALFRAALTPQGRQYFAWQPAVPLGELSVDFSSERAAAIDALLGGADSVAFGGRSLGSPQLDDALRAAGATTIARTGVDGRYELAFRKTVNPNLLAQKLRALDADVTGTLTPPEVAEARPTVKRTAAGGYVLEAIWGDDAADPHRAWRHVYYEVICNHDRESEVVYVGATGEALPADLDLFVRR